MRYITWVDENYEANDVEAALKNAGGEVSKADRVAEVLTGRNIAVGLSNTKKLFLRMFHIALLLIAVTTWRAY